MKIAEIFAREGEAGFRARERAVLEALPAQRCVVALGGGAVVAAENRALLAEKGTLVWLDARPETLVERIGDARRTGRCSRGSIAAARIAKLAALRASARSRLRRARSIRIDTDARSVDEVCARGARGARRSGAPA